MSDTIKKIDIKGLFYAKNKKLARFIPNFIYNYLKKVLHEDDCNEMLTLYDSEPGVPFITNSLKHNNVDTNVIGKENLPTNKRTIFVCNHPLGGFDGIMLIKILHEHYGDVKVLVNDILMNVYPIKEFFVPINKHGSQANELAKILDETYESDVPILTFPAGLVSRRIKGTVMDLKWQKSFVTKAKSYKRNVVPLYFEARNSNFFYNLSSFRKFFGIKANVEMLYLVDELFKHKNKTFNVYIGNEINWDTFDAKQKRPLQWAKWVKEKTYALGGISEVPL